jgi:hypothetical protein
LPYTADNLERYLLHKWPFVGPCSARVRASPPRALAAVHDLADRPNLISPDAGVWFVEMEKSVERTRISLYLMHQATPSRVLLACKNTFFFGGKFRAVLSHAQRLHLADSPSVIASIRRLMNDTLTSNGTLGRMQSSGLLARGTTDAIDQIQQRPGVPANTHDGRVENTDIAPDATYEAIADAFLESCFDHVTARPRGARAVACAAAIGLALATG